VRDWMTDCGVPVFRPALHGNKDKGDLFGVADWTFQCRDTARIDLAGAMDDATEQAGHAKTHFYAAIIKRRRKGPAQAYAVMPLFKLVELLGETKPQTRL
jgi:hypothetical protein